MDFGVVLQEERDHIVTRWFECALALYPDISADAFRRQHDRFANPVGHSLRTAVAAVFDAMSRDDDEIGAEALTNVIKIRAVQDFAPSEALRFVFLLKDIIRTETGVTNHSECAAALREFDARVDRMALRAFDIFVACRESVFELRVNEAKRRVAWVIDRLNNSAEQTASIDLEAVPAQCTPGEGFS